MAPQERTTPCEEDSRQNPAIDNHTNLSNVNLGNGFTNKALENAVQEGLASKTNGELSEKEKKTTDFDDLLPYVGEFGLYQKILFFLMIPFEFFVAFVYFSQIFMTIVPEEHWCWIPELANLTVEDR